MKELSSRDLKELLNKCWMTHDGMWFYHCYRECGIEKANKLNKAAIRSLAPIEMQRVTKAFGIGKIESMADLKALMAAALNSVMADFMRFEISYPSENHFHVKWNRCFAHEGMKRVGAIDGYECGIFERIDAWYDALGVTYEVTPKVTGCMMHTEGVCYRDYRFLFDGEGR